MKKQLTFVEREHPLLLHSLSTAVPCSFVDWVCCGLCLKSDLKKDVWRLEGAHGVTWVAQACVTSPRLTATLSRGKSQRNVAPRD